MKCPVSMTTSCLPPTLVERREKAPISPEAFPLQRLQVVVSRVGLVTHGRGHGGKHGRGVAHSRLGFAASVTSSGASQGERGTAAKDALVPLVGGCPRPVGARPAAWGPVPFLLT